MPSMPRRDADAEFRQLAEHVRVAEDPELSARYDELVAKRNQITASTQAAVRNLTIELIFTMALVAGVALVFVRMLSATADL